MSRRGVMRPMGSLWSMATATLAFWSPSKAAGASRSTSTDGS